MKRFVPKSLSLIAVVAFFIAETAVVSCSAGTPERESPADRLYEKLQKIYTQGYTILGHDDDPVYGHEWVGTPGRSDILETVGDYPGMMSWDLGGLELGRPENLDSVPFLRMAEEVVKQHQRKGFNTFSWHLFNPVDSADSWTIGDFLTVKKIFNDPLVNDNFRNQVRSLASFFNGLKDENGKKIAVIFRPFHENSGNWFWWGKPYVSPEEYVGLWKVIREEFDKEGVDNVLFAYSPDRFYSENEYLEYYPGDDLVDILGVDIYLFNGKEGLEEYIKTADNALAVIKKLSDERGKIAAFTETGSESIPVTDWWTEVLLPLLKSHPVAYVVLWRNAHDNPLHFYAPYPAHPSASNFREFCNDSSILLTKDLQ